MALALVALAQSGKGTPNIFANVSSDFEIPAADISIEQVAAFGAENNLPIPTLNLDALQSSASAFSTSYSPYRQSSIRSSAPSYPTEDPWNVPRYGGTSGASSDLNPPLSATTINGASSTLSGSGLPKHWWKKQEIVTVIIEGQQGHLLNRYTVYEISTDVCTSTIARCYLMKLLATSAVLPSIADILNLLSCGIAWFDDTRSDFSVHFHRSEYNVSLQCGRSIIPSTDHCDLR